MSQNPAPRLFLLDSFALSFRIFYAFARNPLLNSKGQDNSVVHGYLGHLLRILSSQTPSHFAIVKDMGKKNFRHDLYPEYKANRADMPEEMREQLPRLDEILAASGIPILGQEGFEADDVLAHLARKAEAAGFDVFLVTKDKDLGQIVTEHIHMFQLEKGRDVSLMGPTEVKEKFGVPPEQIRDYLALVGDSSDNVPGVPKVGPKSAVELLSAFGTLDAIYANLDQIPRKAIQETLRNNKEKAYLSRELVTLQSTHDFGIALEDLHFRGLRRKDLKEILVANELRSLLRSVDEIPDVAGAPAPVMTEANALLDAPTYTLISTKEDLQALQVKCSSANIIALDTETDSLVGWRANLVGVCIACDEQEGFYLPLGHIQEGSGDLFGASTSVLQTGNLPREHVISLLNHLCSDPNRTLVFHNAKYDIQVLRHAGVQIQSKVVDSMLGAWLLDPDQNTFGLDEQVRKRLGHTMIPIESLIGKGKAQRSFATTAIADASPYGAEDAVFTLRLWLSLEPKLREAGLLDVLHNQEIPLLDSLMEMEQNGIRLELSELEQIRKDLSSRLAQLELDIIRHAGGSAFNINSPKQLGTILFEKIGLPTIRKTSTGYSTDAATLEELRGIHPIVESVLHYREIGKLLNTYVEVLPTLVDPATCRIHTSYLQTGTATGRLSSRDPNLQNIPIRTPEGKRIRAAFIARNDDWVLLSADYSQIELRMLAHLSGDPQLCEAYQQGHDIHAMTAATIFGVESTEVTSDMRRQAKVVNFGVLYGMTAFRLARDLGIERSAAKSFIDGYFGRYSTVKDWVDATVQNAREQGFVSTIAGRRRVIPGIASSDHTERQMAERMAVNSPVQGSAADLLKIAMIRIQNRIQKEHWELKLLLQVHDELVLECPKAILAEASAMVKAEMEGAFALRVPLVAEVGSGRSWLDAH